jgi:hypothetical protein
MKSVMMMMNENQSSQSQVHVTAFGVLGAKHQKAILNRQPGAFMCGGSVLTQQKSHKTEMDS